MKDIDMKIGKFLQDKRYKCGYSLADVGEKMNMSRFTISGYEHGRNSISAKTMLELLKLYNSDIGELYQYVYNEKNN